MKISRMIARATAGTLALAMAANASATELLFDYDEEGDGRDLQFTLDSEPDPYYSSPFNFVVQNVVDQLTGQAFDQGYFWTPVTGGGFRLEDSTDPFGPSVGGMGEQLWTGTTANPMFKVGTFDLLSRATEEPATLTITPVPATVVFDWDADDDGRDLRFSFDVAPSPYRAGRAGIGDASFQLIDVVDELTNQTMRLVSFSNQGDGGFSVVGPGDYALDVNGEKLFFNTTDAPVFRTGSFRLDGTSRLTGGLLTITAQPLNAVPEPATWMMLLLGFAMIGGLMRASGNRPKIRVRYF